MVSSCELRFDDLSISGQKAYVPDEFVFLLQEKDRRTVSFREDDEERVFVGYVSTRAFVLARLELAGFTSDRAVAAFDAFIDQQRSTYHSVSASSRGQDWSASVKLVDEFGYAEWQARLKSVLQTRYTEGKWRDDSYADEIERQMCGLEDDWIFFADPLTSIRAMLDALPDVQEVSLDIAPLIDGGWIEPDDRVCAERREPHAQVRSILQPVMLLAEGSTDNRVLRRSLERLYPHLTDYISFFDYDGARPDAGASFVVKFLKAFAAARINTSILAIFDNDAAGRSAFKTASDLTLPANIKCTLLPDTDLARDYPTIGPQGKHSVDVNGKAGSIELYLGRHNLTRQDGTLSPVALRHSHNLLVIMAGL